MLRSPKDSDQDAGLETDAALLVKPKHLHRGKDTMRQQSWRVVVAAASQSRYVGQHARQHVTLQGLHGHLTGNDLLCTLRGLHGP